MNKPIETEFKTNITKWFHEDACKACSEGLNQRMQELTGSGLSQRKAAEAMSEECKGELSADNIRKRYAYYNKPKKTKKVGKTSQPVQSKPLGNYSTSEGSTGFT